MDAREFKSASIPHMDTSIEARLYGADLRHVVLLSNSSSNDAGEWDALIDAGDGSYAFMTYGYTSDIYGCGDLLSILSWLPETHGTERVILLGAEKGAALSIMAAASRQHQVIDALILLSPPLTRNGKRLYSMADLRMITCPKLVIATEFENTADEARQIFAELEDPRYSTLYPGDAVGAGIFAEHGDSLVQQLTEYIPWAFSR